MPQHHHTSYHICTHTHIHACTHAAPKGSNSYGFVEVFQDRIVIKGVGTVTHRQLRLPDRLVDVS